MVEFSFPLPDTFLYWFHVIKICLYLVKLEEGPKLLLGTGGGPLSVWVVILSLGIVGSDALFL